MMRAVVLLTSFVYTGALFCCSKQLDTPEQKRKKISNAVFWQKRKTLAALLADKRVPVNLNSDSVGSDVENTFGWKNIIGLRIGLRDPLTPLETAIFVRPNTKTVGLLLAHGVRPTQPQVDRLFVTKKYAFIESLLAYQAVDPNKILRDIGDQKPGEFLDAQTLLLLVRFGGNKSAAAKIAEKIIQQDATTQPLFRNLFYEAALQATQEMQDQAGRLLPESKQSVVIV